MLVNFCNIEAAARFYRRNSSVKAADMNIQPLHVTLTALNLVFEKKFCKSVTSCRQHRLIKIIISFSWFGTPKLHHWPSPFFVYRFTNFWLLLALINKLFLFARVSCLYRYIRNGQSFFPRFWTPVFGPSCSMRATLFMKLSKLLNKHGGLAEKMTFLVVVYASLKSK